MMFASLMNPISHIPSFLVLVVLVSFVFLWRSPQLWFLRRLHALVSGLLRVNHFWLICIDSGRLSGWSFLRHSLTNWINFTKFFGCLSNRGIGFAPKSLQDLDQLVILLIDTYINLKLLFFFLKGAATLISPLKLSVSTWLLFYFSAWL